MSEHDYDSGCAWVDGNYVPLNDARIPLMDMGFLHCDATYDVVAVWNRRYFRLTEHLDRFQTSWQRLRMTPPLSASEIRAILDGCVSRAGLDNAYVSMIMSRGVALPGIRDPRKIENRFYAYATSYSWIVKPEDQEVGTHLIISEKTIRIPNQAVDPTVKNFHWGDMVRGLFEAYDRGGQTIVLADADGNIIEGPGFNVFAYDGNTLRTPAVGMLEGVTRRTVLELSGEMGIPTAIEQFDTDVLRNAEEIFITSTAGGVMPATTLDGEPGGTGKPGPVTLRLRQVYWDAHDEERWTTPVNY